MDVAALIISIAAIGVALVVSGFGIWLQWKMFEASSNQLNDAQKLLSKLEGVSLQLRGTQEQQFNTLLDAVVKKDAGDAATVLGDRLEDVESELQKRSVDASVIRELKEAVEDMQEKTKALEEPLILPTPPSGRFFSDSDPLTFNTTNELANLLKRVNKQLRSPGEQAELEAEGMDDD